MLNGEEDVGINLTRMTFLSLSSLVTTRLKALNQAIYAFLAPHLPLTARSLSHKRTMFDQGMRVINKSLPRSNQKISISGQ